MKRKIAAILAADVAGYSKLMAEDEEETARRLVSYRAVFHHTVARFSGRIVNTAGDSVLAEFASSVEAVRCAIDMQESLRVFNLAYPPSRQMNWRIGVTVADVIDREGDVMGDGVNIAARLEALAPPGGICVSRTVYEQVRSKMSVSFFDLGEQEVKHLPFPVHAYTLALSSKIKAMCRQQERASKSGTWTWPAAIVVAAAAVLASAVILSETVGTGISKIVLRDVYAQALNGQPQGKGPCFQVRTACEQAGFQAGAAGSGNGLWIDCMMPLIKGTSQRPRATKPLPKVDVQAVDTCKMQLKTLFHNFGTAESL